VALFSLLSGYKTWIGLVLFGFGSICDLLQIEGAKALMDLGGVLAGIGAAHKAMKGQ